MLKSLWNKWITPASIQIWFLVAGAFGALVIIAKETLKALWKAKQKNKELDNELKRAERIQDVEINTDRDAAVKRLREHGDIRED